MTDDIKTPAKKPRKKKTTAPSRAKAIQSAVQPKESPKPSMMPAPSRPSPKRSLMPVFIGILAIIVLLVFVQHGSKMALPKLPEMPSITLPEMPDVSGLFAFATPEEEVVITDEQPPVAEEYASDDTETKLLKQQLAEAEEKIQQLQSIVQEKDQAIQREITLRGQSLLAQYARLMERALEEGLPFTWELEQFQRIAESNHNAEATTLAQALVPYAQGVSSDKKLRDDFDLLSSEIYARWKKETAGSGIKAGLSRMFQQIITIRPVGLVEGDTPDAILARTQYFLEQKNLGEARKQLQTLEDEYALISKVWLEQSALRMEVEKNMQLLRDFAQKIAPSTQKTEPAPAPEKTEPEADDLAQPPAEVQAP